MLSPTPVVDPTASMRPRTLDPLSPSSRSQIVARVPRLHMTSRRHLLVRLLSNTLAQYSRHETPASSDPCSSLSMLPAKDAYQADLEPNLLTTEMMLPPISETPQGRSTKFPS